MRKALVAAALVLLAAPAPSPARDLAGRFALGYFSPDAPIGGRYQVSQKSALDLGFGFAQKLISDDPTTAADGDSKKNLQWHVEAGIPYTLVERGSARFFVRPGVLFRFIPTYNRATVADPYESKTETELEFTALLGAEWFATEDLSFSVGHGLRVVSGKGVTANQLTTGDPNTETFVDGLQALDITRIGFHFYF